MRLSTSSGDGDLLSDITKLPVFGTYLPDGMFAAIGAVAVYWSALERSVDIILTKLWDTPYCEGVERPPINLQSYKKRVRLIRQMMPNMPDDKRALLDGALAGLSSLKRRRDIIVHGAWVQLMGAPQDQRQVVSYRFDREITTTVEQLTVPEIEAVAREIESHGLALIKIIFWLHGAWR